MGEKYAHTVIQQCQSNWTTSPFFRRYIYIYREVPKHEEEKTSRTKPNQTKANQTKNNLKGRQP